MYVEYRCFILPFKYHCAHFSTKYVDSLRKKKVSTWKNFSCFSIINRIMHSQLTIWLHDPIDVLDKSTTKSIDTCSRFNYGKLAMVVTTMLVSVLGFLHVDKLRSHLSSCFANISSTSFNTFMIYLRMGNCGPLLITQSWG